MESKFALATFTVFLYSIGYLLEGKYPQSPVSNQHSRWRHLLRNLVVASYNYIFLAGVGAAVTFASLSAADSEALQEPAGLVGVASIVLLILGYDLLNYLVHRSLHRFPVLWRTHRVHHKEIDLAGSSAFFFHPTEALYRGVWQVLYVWLLAMPLSALLAYQFWVMFALIYAHTNVRVPSVLYKTLKVWVVFPNDHRVHHGITMDRQNSNFGIGFMIWDHLFKTYRPADNQIDLIGLSEQHSSRSNSQPLTSWQAAIDPLMNR